MAHFAILCPEAGGHLIPMGALGQELIRRGHEVTLIARAKAATLAQRSGLNFAELECGSFGPYLPPSRVLSTAVYALRLGVPFALQKRFLYRAGLVLHEAPKLLQDLAVDAVLVDQNVVAGSSVAEHLRLPYVTICPALHWNEEAGVPPAFVGWPYADSVAARLRNRVAWSAWHSYIKPVLNLVNQQRKSWNLKPLQNFSEIYSPWAQISQLCDGFDFPRRELASTFHYIGALAADRPDEKCAFPWHRLDGRPLIYASLGTVAAARNTTALKKIALAVKGLDAQLLISAGAWANDNHDINIRLKQLAGDPVVVDFAPQMAVLEKADLMITHGGVNSVLEALSHAVPLVALPRAADQHGMAARITRAGVGLVACFSKFTVDKLRSLVQLALEDGGYRHRARSVGQNLRAAGGVRRAAEIIEETVR